MRYEFTVVQTATAPIDVVWDVIADATRWSEWGRFKVSRLEVDGAPVPNGVGALRVFGNPPVVSREEVVVFDAPHHLAYELRSGLPINGYRADVHLVADGDTTRITWTGGFDRARPAFTSAGFRAFLHRFIADTAKRAAATAEARARG